jgi:hypothetical protein
MRDQGSVPRQHTNSAINIQICLHPTRCVFDGYPKYLIVQVKNHKDEYISLNSVEKTTLWYITSALLYAPLA